MILILSKETVNVRLFGEHIVHLQCLKERQNKFIQEQTHGKMKQIFKKAASVVFVMLAFTACNEHDFEGENNDLYQRKNASSDSEVIVLGKHYPNPYSVRNMLAAYSELKNSGENIGNINIRTTDLYVRFLPKDTAQYNALSEDTSMVLFDYPLDYEIVQEGEYYHDPSIPEDSYTWLYTTVPAGYQFNPNITYEILDSCYISRDDNENIISDDDKLEQMSFKLLGLDKIFADSEDQGAKGWFRGKKPKGTYRVYDTDLGYYVPVKCAQAICHNIVKWGYARIGKNGRYEMNKKFHTRVYYKIKYSNSKSFNIRYPVLTAYSRFGFHGKSGYSKDIAPSGNSWKLATINNAAYEYYDICTMNKILTPPNNLKIFMTNFSRNGAAPMLTRVYHPIGANSHSSWLSFFANIVYGLPATVINNTILKLVGPDIVIGGNTEKSLSLYKTTCHELAHASHFRQVGSEYWALYISYIMTYGAYGDVGDYNSGVCGVGEMWGYTMGNVLANEKYNKDMKSKVVFWFNWRILSDIMTQGVLSKRQIFDCLTNEVRSHDELKSKMKLLYPIEANRIEEIFGTYGF